MIIKEYLGKEAARWDTRVLATDISQNVLSQAERGIYPKESLAALPETRKNKYFNEVKG